MLTFGNTVNYNTAVLHIGIRYITKSKSNGRTVSFSGCIEKHEKYVDNVDVKLQSASDVFLRTQLKTSSTDHLMCVVHHKLTHKHTVFTRSIHEKAVRLSVCLSVRLSAFQTRDL